MNQFAYRNFMLERFLCERQRRHVLLDGLLRLFCVDKRPAIAKNAVSFPKSSASFHGKNCIVDKLQKQAVQLQRESQKITNANKLRFSSCSNKKKCEGGCEPPSNCKKKPDCSKAAIEKKKKEAEECKPCASKTDRSSKPSTKPPAKPSSCGKTPCKPEKAQSSGSCGDLCKPPPKKPPPKCPKTQICPGKAKEEKCPLKKEEPECSHCAPSLKEVKEQVRCEERELGKHEDWQPVKLKKSSCAPKKAAQSQKRSSAASACSPSGSVPPLPRMDAKLPEMKMPKKDLTGGFGDFLKNITLAFKSEKKQMQHGDGSPTKQNKNSMYNCDSCKVNDDAKDSSSSSIKKCPKSK